MESFHLFLQVNWPHRCSWVRRTVMVCLPYCKIMILGRKRQVKEKVRLFYVNGYVLLSQIIGYTSSIYLCDRPIVALQWRVKVLFHVMLTEQPARNAFRVQPLCSVLILDMFSIKTAGFDMQILAGGSGNTQAQESTRNVEFLWKLMHQQQWLHGKKKKKVSSFDKLKQFYIKKRMSDRNNEQVGSLIVPSSGNQTNYVNSLI